MVSVHLYQETIKLKREREIRESQNKIAVLDVQIASETKPDKLAKLQEQKLHIKVRKPYEKKQPPKWMKDRGVSLQ